MNSETWYLLDQARRVAIDAVQHPDKSLPALGLLFFAMAFTRKQVLAIRHRDNNQSQMRHYDEEQGWHTSPKRPGDTVQVHHIVPQGMGGTDTPENGITLWTREHVGKGALPGEFVVHPDTEQARQDYATMKGKAYQKMREKRNKKKENGEPYWNTLHDVEMSETAQERTQNAIMSGWRFPQKRKKT